MKYLSYDLSKLASEKGFNDECVAVYENKDTLQEGEDSYYAYVDVNAPTHQQIIDWFIEKHNIHPSYGSNHSGWYWEITKTNGTLIIQQDNAIEDYYDNHYGAYNKAITEAFKII